MDITLPEYSLKMMLPEIVLFVLALVVVTYDLVTRRKSGASVGYLAMASLVVTGVVLAFTGTGAGWGNMFYNDTLALFFKVIFLGAAFMAIGSCFGIAERKILHHRGEFYGLMMFSTVGMMFLASARELISLYIGLELTTVPLFVLAGFFKDDKRSVEAGIKYLIVGAFSSALLLYGFSFLYGLTGTTDIFEMRYHLAGTWLARGSMVGVSVMILAVVTIIAGLGFKLALPPFHQWAPDVYEGAPTPVTAFLSVGSKAAGLVAFIKVVVVGLYSYYAPIMAPNDWGMLVGVLACAAMIVGNVLAIRQTNIKRMLAYSSIAHAGYIMVGIIAVNQYGLASVSFYMFAYLFTNMGAFAIVTMFEDKTGSCQIADYDGLARTSPFVSLALTVFLLSLTGIPPLAGFVGKFYVFAAAIEMAAAGGDTWIYWVVGVALITSVFALYYYANVMKVMYFGKSENPVKLTFTTPSLVVVAIALVGVFLFGLNPQPVLDFLANIPVSYGLVLP